MLLCYTNNTTKVYLSKLFKISFLLSSLYLDYLLSSQVRHNCVMKSYGNYLGLLLNAHCVECRLRDISLFFESEESRRKSSLLSYNLDGSLFQGTSCCSLECQTQDKCESMENQLLPCLNNYASFKIFTRHSMMITIMQGNKQWHIQHQSNI